MNDKLTIAEALPEEIPLIVDSWARNFGRSPYAGTIPNDQWPTVSRDAILHLLQRGSRVLVVHNLVGGPRTVLAYAVTEPEAGLLHYVYTKEKFRKRGLGGALMQRVEDLCGGPGTYTHKTKDSKFVEKRGWRWYAVPARLKSWSRNPEDGRRERTSEISRD